MCRLRHQVGIEWRQGVESEEKVFGRRLSEEKICAGRVSEEKVGGLKIFSGCSLGQVADRFDVVALGVNDKRTVVVLVIVRTQAGYAVVLATCSHRRFV